MKRLILNIFDYLSEHKIRTIFIMIAVLSVSVVSALRMHYDEDISSFLPKNEESSRYYEVYRQIVGSGKIAVFFEGESEDEIREAMSFFEDTWAEVDSTHIVPDLHASAVNDNAEEVFDFISSNWPYFLTENDYERMDSLLSDKNFVHDKMICNLNAQYDLSSAYGMDYMRRDPLSLFSPVLNRLMDYVPASGISVSDDMLFTEDGVGVVFFDSPFGDSETGANSGLIDILSEVKAKTRLEFKNINIFSTGAPEVAVENSRRIKKDSSLALLIAAIIISMILWLSYKRLSDVGWILLSVAAGAIFALGLIAIFKSTISVIILGIGSMIIGVAVNYPLHFIDHLKYQPDKRKALADQIYPLLVGNITTVGSFLSLSLVKSDALRDFGMVGAAMLLGTIIFILVFLPVLASPSKRPRNTVRLNFDRYINIPYRWRPILFSAFLVGTVVMYFIGRNIAFDTDMHHINYMTESQERGFSILEGASADSLETIYFVSEGQDADKALSKDESLDINGLKSISDFVPSHQEQQQRIGRWNDFWARHPELINKVKTEASDLGFNDIAFQPFFSVVQGKVEEKPIDYFDTLLETLGKGMYIQDGDKVRIVSRLMCNDAKSVAQRYRTDLPSGTFCFSQSDVSGSLVDLLSVDFDNVGLLCSIIVFFFLWASFGSIELSLISFLPLVLGWIWILGTMKIFGWQFNIVNIILATFIFGQGDDYTIFMTEGLMYEFGTGKKILHSFKNAVALSALIMFVGIGALIVARHPAMRSLAEVTIVGMVMVVMMAYYVPPFIFKAVTGRQSGMSLTIGNILSTVYIFSVFLIAMLLLSAWTFLFFLFGESERKKERFHRLLQKTSYCALKMLPGCKYKMDNPYNEDFSKPAIYICNHQSHFDVLALLSVTPKLVLITNEWVWNSPFYGYILHKADCIPAMDGIENNLSRMKEMMDKGYSIGIFPEGTRSLDCSVQRFHRGAFLAAKTLEVDILPFYIHGFGYAMPKKDFMLRKADLYMKVGQRIGCSEIDVDIKAFTRKMRHAYCSEYNAIRKRIETATYIAPFVWYRYIYKGVDAMKECRSVIRRRLTEADLECRKDIIIEDAGYGCYALLLALTHPESNIIAYIAEQEKYLVASRCAGIPDNLQYINEGAAGLEKQEDL